MNKDGEWKRYEEKPILAPDVEGTWDCNGVAFASALYNDKGDWNILYSGKQDKKPFWEIGIATVNITHGGINKTIGRGGKVFEKGKSGSFDSLMAYCPIIWREEGEARMLYTGYAAYNTGVGHAYSYCTGYAAGRNEKELKRMKNGEPVFIGGFPWNKLRVEMWSTIKVKDIYYHWYSTMGDAREIGYATSSAKMTDFEDQSPAPAFGCGSGYKAKRYCPCVFKHGSYYYIIIVEAKSRDDQRFAMYRSKEPTFLADEREYVRSVLFSHKEIHWEAGGNIDAPFVLTSDINRDITGQKEVIMLFSGYGEMPDTGKKYKEKGCEAIGMTVEEDVERALMPVKTDDRRSLSL